MKMILFVAAFISATTVQAQVLLQNVSKNSVFQIKAEEIIIPANATHTFLGFRPLEMPEFKDHAVLQPHLYCYLLSARSDTSMRITNQTKLKVVRTIKDNVYAANDDESPFSKFIYRDNTVVVDLALATNSGQRFGLECGMLTYHKLDKKWIASNSESWTNVASTASVEGYLSFIQGDIIVVE